MTSRKLQSATDARRKGAAAVEFALAGSILVMLMLAATDLGRFVYVYVTMSNAAGEGATFGCQHGVTEFGSVGAWETAVVNATVEETTILPVDADDVTVDSSALTSGLCRVTVAQQFDVLFPWPWLPESLTLTREVVMPLIP